MPRVGQNHLNSGPARRADMANPECGLGTGNGATELSRPHGIQRAAAKEAGWRRTRLLDFVRYCLGQLDGASPMRLPDRVQRACLSLVRSEELRSAFLARERATEERLQVVLGHRLAIGNAIRARLEIPAGAVNLAQPIAATGARLRRAAVRAARDGTREVHAWYLRHRFFLEYSNQFIGEHGIAGPSSDQPKPSSSVRFKPHGHIHLGWLGAPDTAP